MDNPNQNKNNANISTKPSTQKGCLSGMLMLLGILLAIYSLLGYVLGLFGYVLKVSGSELPKVDLESLIPLLIISAIFFGVGYLMDVFLYRKAKK